MKQKGFTLVELLVVIAIIGILSTVAIVNLNSARDKAKFAAAQAALSQMATPMILCMDEEVGGATVTWLADGPVADQEPCDATAVDGSEFPNLGTGWTYSDTGAYWGHDYSTYEWHFCAVSSSGDDIDCTQDGCSATSTCPV